MRLVFLVKDLIMKLAVINYIDADEGKVVCCCLDADFQLYGNSVIGMSSVVKGLASDLNDAVTDCVTNLALSEKIDGEVEFEIIAVDEVKAQLH
jgi:hypothetical protein